MAITVKFRRGSTTESNSFLGEEGELYIDKDKDTVVVHDGFTVGGKSLASEAWVTQAISNFGSSSFSGSYNDLTDKPILFSGAYNDLTGLPILFSGSYNDLTNKPILFSGSYNDLTDKPTTSIIIEGTNLYYTDERARASISVSGSLAYNSTTGVISYTAPTNISSFTNDLNYQTAAEVATSISNLVNSAPATLDTLNELASALGNDPSFATTTATSLGNRLRVDINTQNLTTAQKSNAVTNLGLSTVATSGSYNDLSNKPTTSGISEGTNLYYTDTRARAALSASTGISYNSTTGAISTTITQYTNALARSAISVSGSLSYNSTTGVISYTAPSLSTVATSGSYNDLSNKPTIPVIGQTSGQVPSYDANGWLQISDAWKVKETSGVLYFAYGGANKMKLDSSGNLTVVGDVTAYGSV